MSLHKPIKRLTCWLVFVPNFKANPGVIRLLLSALVVNDDLDV